MFLCFRLAWGVLLQFINNDLIKRCIAQGYRHIAHKIVVASAANRRAFSFFSKSCIPPITQAMTPHLNGDGD